MPCCRRFGIVTGRRIGQLAFLRREDFHHLNDVWVIEVRSHLMRNGVWEVMPVDRPGVQTPIGTLSF
jgi:hypothetical protein